MVFKRVELYEIFLGQAGNKQDFYNRRAERSISTQDISRRLVISGNYDLPFGKGRKMGTNMSKPLDMVLGGWTIGYVMQGRTGFPITISTTGQSQQSPRGTQRPNYLRPLTVTDRSIQRWFGTGGTAIECAQGTDNGTCAYQRPALGAFGNASIATERAPAFFNADVSIGKSVQVREGHRLDFRAEFYNLANMTMFSPPARDVSSPGTFGLISGQANNPRNIQFGLKYIF